MHCDEFEVTAPRRGLHDITRQVARIVEKSGAARGVCNVFLQHTSASLCIQENADPTARADLEAYFDKLVPEGLPYFRHTVEGPDDMPSHIKSALTGVSLTIPVRDGALSLGTWQGIYLWEHRDSTSRRRVIVTVWS